MSDSIMEDCLHVIQEGLDVLVRWQDHAHLSAQANGVKLRFYLWDGARLYSYRLAEDAP